MQIPIIYEDDNILVINKPSGIVVHPFDFSAEETVLDFLLNYLPSMNAIDNPVLLQDKRMLNLGGMVHKLDRDTSGVMVVAKNQEVFNELQKQFKSHIVTKKYIALVEGTLEQEHFVIDAPLGRNKKSYKQEVSPASLRGTLREAVTEVTLMKQSGNKTLTLLVPKTGRTHQLRAHMSSIGHPIIGDKAYGSTVEAKRIMLHAQELSFSLFGREYLFEAETPQEFEV